MDYKRPSWVKLESMDESTLHIMSLIVLHLQEAQQIREEVLKIEVEYLCRLHGRDSSMSPEGFDPTTPSSLSYEAVVKTLDAEILLALNEIVEVELIVYRLLGLFPVEYQGHIKAACLLGPPYGYPIVGSPIPSME